MPESPEAARRIGGAHRCDTCDMRRRPPVVLLGVSFVLTGCASTPPRLVTTAPTIRPATTSSPGPLGSSVASSGCGATVVYRGGVPAWLVAAAGGSGSQSGAPTYLPYVITDPPIAGGYLFIFPLHSGAHAPNKILWAVGLPRDGSDLVITAHPLTAAKPVITETLADDSFPGEIYPDGLAVPTAGCWQLTLSWSGHRALLDLAYT
jgi:hypothetical protein